MQSTIEKAQSIFNTEQEEAKNRRIAAIEADLSEATRRQKDHARLRSLIAASEIISKKVDATAKELADALAVAVIDRLTTLENLKRDATETAHEARRLGRELGVPERCPAILPAPIVRRAVGVRFQQQNRLDLATALDRWLCVSLAEMNRPEGE